jgi:long-subunit fatty acid transport protein
MMKQRLLSRCVYSLVLAGLTVGTVSVGLAQFPEDALRLSTPGMGVGTRAFGMGNAYTGIANDFSAIYWNPAGLGQLDKSEFSFGLSYQTVKNTSSFYGIETPFSLSATTVNTAGLVIPVPTKRGSLVVAFGYNRDVNFTNPLSFTGFNPSSSFIQSSAPDGALYPQDLTNVWAYQLFLANLDTLNGRYISPIKNRLTQSATVTESGGINDWSGALALEVAHNLFAGVTLTYYAGTYNYNRSYVEEDKDKLYQTFPYDVSRFTYDDYITDHISGFGAKFGILYRGGDLLRLGFAIKTPTYYHVDETFGARASSYFDNGDIYPVGSPYTEEFVNTYDVYSPWVFSSGVSFNLWWLVISGDVEFTDWTGMEFANAPQEILDNNKTIRETMKATLDYRLGAEFDLFGTGLRVRAGLGMQHSPYKEDPAPIPGDFFTTDFNRRSASVGLGIPLGSTAMFDLGYRATWWKNYRLNYPPEASSRVDESLRDNQVIGTFSFRF